MNDASAERDVKGYLRGLIRDDDLELASGEAIFSSGLLDSFSVTQLICFLEDHFGVKISIADVTIEDFDSIDRILVLLRRLGALPASA